MRSQLWGGAVSGHKLHTPAWFLTSHIFTLSLNWNRADVITGPPVDTVDQSDAGTGLRSPREPAGGSAGRGRERAGVSVVHPPF